MQEQSNDLYITISKADSLALSSLDVPTPFGILAIGSLAQEKELLGKPAVSPNGIFPASILLSSKRRPSIIVWIIQTAYWKAQQVLILNKAFVAFAFIHGVRSSRDLKACDFCVAISCFKYHETCRRYPVFSLDRQTYLVFRIFVLN